MKKNKLMRLSAVLFALTLVTTSVVSGTFAKYVASDSTSDTARVAKFGAVATVSGSLFGENYYAGNYTTVTSQNEISAAAQNSVDTSVSTQNIVAPGTKNTSAGGDSKGLTLSVSGTPEVATTVTYGVEDLGTVTVNQVSKAITASNTYSDIWLANGKYGIMVKVTDSTAADNYSGLYTVNDNVYSAATSYASGTEYYKLITDNTVDLKSDAWSSSTTETRYVSADGKYYPIIWTAKSSLKEINASGADANAKKVITKNKVSELATILSSYYANVPNNANVNLATAGVGSITFTWEWPFESVSTDSGDKKLVDNCDTILGDLMAYESGNSNYQVVQITTTATADDTITGLLTASDDPTMPGVTYAYVANDSDKTPVASLTVGFNAKVTITQVD